MSSTSAGGIAVLLCLLFLVDDVAGVKPVWRTPVSEPNVPSDGKTTPPKEREKANLSKRAQPNYYTQPDQFSVPDYRRTGPRRNGQTSNFASPQFRQQFLPQQNFARAGPQANFGRSGPQRGPQPFLPPNWQQLPMQMVWVPDYAVRVPPQGAPYWFGAPPVPPQGVYGPSPSTQTPAKPSANPQNYQGTLAHSPAATQSEPTSPYVEEVTSSAPYSQPSPVSSSTAAPESAAYPKNPYGPTEESGYSHPISGVSVDDYGRGAPAPSSDSEYATSGGTQSKKTETRTSSESNGPVRSGSEYEPNGPANSDDDYGPTTSSRPTLHTTYDKDAEVGYESGPSRAVSTTDGYEDDVTQPFEVPKVNPYEDGRKITVPTSDFKPSTVAPVYLPPDEKDDEEKEDEEKEDEEQGDKEKDYEKGETTAEKGSTTAVVPPETEDRRPENRVEHETEDSLKDAGNGPNKDQGSKNERPTSETSPNPAQGPTQHNNDNRHVNPDFNPRDKLPSPQEDEETMLNNFFPRPATAQAYQPPGHVPDEFTSHIDVHFKKPSGKSCNSPLCTSVDVDKVSLYKPEAKNQGGGPTLVISNVAKDVAARSGYIAPPQPANPYIPPEGSSQDYAQPYTNPPEQWPFPPISPQVHPLIPTTRAPGGDVPRALIPAHYFSPPPTMAPEEIDEIETTVPFIPTARTIAPRPTSTLPPALQATKPAGRTVPPKPEFLPPSIEHAMTPSVPRASEENQPTYRPLHHEDIETSPPTLRPQTPAIVTRPPSQGIPEELRTSAAQPKVPSAENQETYVTGPTTTTGQFGSATTSRPSPRPREDTPTSPRPIGQYQSTSPPVGPTSSTSGPSRQPLGSTPPVLATSQPTSRPNSLGFNRVSTTSSIRSPDTRGSTPQQGNSFVPSTSNGPTPPTRPTPSDFGKTVQVTFPRNIERPDEHSPGASTSFPTLVTDRPRGSPPAPQDAFSPGVSPSPSSTPRAPNRNPYAPPEGIPVIPNRVRGKPHIVCKEDGISFEAKTILPFTGQIFANDRKRIPECIESFDNVTNPIVFLPFEQCGVRNNGGDQKDTRVQFHMQVVLVVDHGDGTNTLQSFMAQCVHQKDTYDQQSLPKRIEEALEELRLVPSRLEQKASLPTVEMQLLVDRGHHNVSAADIGMPLAIHWSLKPESDAYGFHVRNCMVVDTIGHMEHKIIDEQGCSTDLSIIDHPHYDSLRDTAAAHMWAFKVPDMASLRIKCDVFICAAIKATATNMSSCEDIPSPPFCADVVTSPPNSILSDASRYVKQRRDALEASFLGETSSTVVQSVRAALCLSQDCHHDYSDDVRVCVDSQFATASTGFSMLFLMFAIAVNVVMRFKR